MKDSSKNLINEELKRFRQISEYSFYVPEDYDEYDDPDDILLDEDEEDEEEADVDVNADDADIDVDADVEGGDDISDLEGDEGDMEPDAEEDPEADIDFGDEGLSDETPEDELEAEPAEDEIELDVTDLVQGTEEAKQSADMANQKIDNLMGMLDNLEDKLNNMDGISHKIEDLENEVEKRMPTEEEKLEMRSLDSYPYNLKLTDYWSEKEGQYDVTDEEQEGEPEEYVLTQDEVDADYSEMSAKDSLEDDEYEEEEI